MSLSHIEQIIISVTQKIPAFFSVLGSSMIIVSVASSAKNRSNPQQRIVGIMSCIDFLVSCTWLTTNLWVDKDYPWFLGIGNEISCAFQGFIVQFSTGSILYNGCLSIYYLLVVRYGWKQVKLLKAEKMFHGICLTFGLVTAICATSLGLMHPVDWDCWINSDFRLVDEDGNNTDPNKQLASDLQILFFFAPLWICIALSFGCVLFIYWKVRTCEERSSIYHTNPLYQRKLKCCREVAKQAKLFITAFFVTWSFPTIVRIIQYSKGTPPNWLILLAGTLIPSQGFFNALVYFRLRFDRKKLKNQDKSAIRIVGEIIKSSTVFSFCCRGKQRSMSERISDLEPNPDPELSDVSHSYHYNRRIHGVEEGQSSAGWNEEVEGASTGI